MTFGITRFVRAVLVGLLLVVSAATTQAASIRQAPDATPASGGAPQAVCPPTLLLGEVFDCSLTAAQEVDEYSFNASINDVFVFRVLRTSGSFAPNIIVSEESGCSQSNTIKVLLECTMTSSGTFHLQIKDYYQNTTGGYRVYVQRLNNPSNVAPVGYGILYTGSITSQIASVSYKFSANVNDLLVLRVKRISGTIAPDMQVYNSQGIMINGCSRSDTSYARVESCAIDETGTYFLFINDYYTQNTGNYQLFLQRYNQPGQAKPIALGTTYNESLTAGIKLNAYTFAAQANDQLIFRVYRTSGTMAPFLRVVDPAGTVICDDSTNSPLARVEPCAIPQNGQYTLFVSDYYAQNPGTYRIYTQRINNPGNARAIAFGQTIGDGLTLVGGFDTYTFNARAASLISVKLTRTSGAFTPYLRVYNAGGQLVCDAANSSAAEITNCSLSTAGRYTLIADDYYRQNVGNYSLALGCASGLCSAPPALRLRVHVPFARR